MELYGEGLLTSLHDDGSAFTTWLRYEDGRRIALDLPRWIAAASPADDALLSRCTGPTLDIGCGPGRLTRALVARRIDCLGVDVAPVAVALASTGGTPVLHASIYDEILDDTRWATVLLADGNIGIGGDPVMLLARAGALCTGNVLVELDAPWVQTSRLHVRIETSAGRESSWFPWAHVSAADIGQVASKARMTVNESWCAEGRWFAELLLGC